MARINPESIFRKKVIAALKGIKSSWWESISQKSIIGTPDIVGLIGGIFVALELKATSRSKISPMQLYKLEEIEGAGGLAFILHPGNYEQIIPILYELGELYGGKIDQCTRDESTLHAQLKELGPAKTQRKCYMEPGEDAQTIGEESNDY